MRPGLEIEAHHHRRGLRAASCLIAAALLAACAPAVQRTGLPSQWVPSPNFDARRPQFVILHYTGARSAGQAVATLTNPLREVSAHYLVGRDGSLVQLVDERARAWHAGESRWGALDDLNSVSIGVELDNDGRSPFPDVQLGTLLTLLGDLTTRLRIPPSNVLGHADVAPRRKRDPGPLFPWKTLADAGYGPWCDPPYPEPPAGFDPVAGLRLIGYDVSDLAAAVVAFKARFMADDSGPALDAATAAAIRCVAERAAK